MNYQRIYDQIVDRAKSQNRTKSKDVYYEAHHIIPKCMGGLDDKSNLVLLTAREHFLCHWLLHFLHPNNTKLARAFNMMCIVKDSNQLRYTPSSRIIEYAKYLHSELSKNQVGYWKNKNMSIETKEKLRIVNTGKSHTDATKEKMSLSRKGCVISWGDKISESKKGKLMSEEHKKKLKEAKSGKKWTEKQKLARQQYYLNKASFTKTTN